MLVAMLGISVGATIPALLGLIWYICVKPLNETLAIQGGAKLFRFTAWYWGKVFWPVRKLREARNRNRFFREFGELPEDITRSDVQLELVKRALYVEEVIREQDRVLAREQEGRATDREIDIGKKMVENALRYFWRAADAAKACGFRTEKKWGEYLTSALYDTIRKEARRIA